MNKSRVTGYRIRYSRYADMSKASTRVVKGYKCTYRTINKFRKRTRYYVRIQTYMVVKGKTYYSDWSRVRSVRVR